MGRSGVFYFSNNLYLLFASFRGRGEGQDPGEEGRGNFLVQLKITVPAFAAYCERAGGSQHPVGPQLTKSSPYVL